MNYEFIKRKNSLWLIKKYMLAVETSSETMGLRIFSGDSYPYKPTTAFFCFFEKYITKGFIELNDKDCKDMIFRRDMTIDSHHKGYIGLKNKSYFFGVGLAKAGVLVSQVPKKIANQLSAN